jgi:integrase
VLKPHTLYCLFGLLSATGTRLTEALNLKPEDIDWEQGVLTIGRVKFQKSRLVPLHESTLMQLRAQSRQVLGSISGSLTATYVRAICRLTAPGF